MQKQANRSGITAVVSEIHPASKSIVSQAVKSQVVRSQVVRDRWFELFEIRWLPSIPLLNKRNAPPAAGIGILYSEEQDRVFHFFETADLSQSINSCSRQQASALAHDPNCRLSWYETDDAADRTRVMNLLRSRSGPSVING